MTGIPTPQITLGSCRVSKIVDGDTIEVEVVRKVRVRITDCWAAESRQTDRRIEKREGLKAKAVAASMFPAGMPVVLQLQSDGDLDIGDDITFGRVLGDVWSTSGSGLSFGDLMKTSGHAFETKADLHAHLDRIEHEEGLTAYESL